MLTWAEKLQHFVKLQKTSLLLFEFSHVCIAQSTNLQSLKVILKKMALSYTDDLQRLRYREERVGVK